MLSLPHSTKCTDRDSLLSLTAMRANTLQNGVGNIFTRYAHLLPQGDTLRADITGGCDRALPHPCVTTPVPPKGDEEQPDLVHP